MAQYARPDSDVTVSGWTPSTGSTLYECIDESSASDADYIHRVRADDTCEVGLSNVTDPVSSSGHVLRVRNQKNGAGSLGTCTAKLMQGASTIGTWTLTAGSIATDAFTLSSGEADSITDYSDLRVQITVDWISGLTTGLAVTWVEFEVPDAPAAGGVPKQMMHYARSRR